MAEKKFYITRYLRNSETGVWGVDGKRRSLEDDFGYLRYKSMTGINSLGKQKGVYTESYPEADSLRVFVDENAKRESVTSTLTVYSFGADPSRVDGDKDVAEQVKAMEDNWHSFLGFLQGALLLWYDDYRQRKGLFLLQEAVEPTTDNIKNIPYLQCQVKLTNVFGQTYGSGDTMIEDWLSRGGKEE